MWLVLILFVVYFNFAQSEVKKNDIPADMVRVPGGTFEMGIAKEDLKTLVEMGRNVPHMSEGHAMRWFGDEIPKHPVTIKPFFMDKYEVSNKQFVQFVRETNYKTEGKWQQYAGKDRQDHPVINVSWNDASAFASWAGKRLPFEAEWEYAARGGKNVKWFPWGNSPDSSCANYRHQGESFWEGVIRLLGGRKMNTQTVGSYKPNGYGLYDMCGNVSEWCEDDHKSYPGGTQPQWVYTGKVVRDGNWESPNPVFVRLNNRNGFAPGYFKRHLGFRCAKSIK